MFDVKGQETADVQNFYLIKDSHRRIEAFFPVHMKNSFGVVKRFYFL